MTHPDPIDEAAEREQQLIDLALLNRPKPTMTFTGLCHNPGCDEKTEKGFFCCRECKEDFEKLEHAKKHRRAV